MKHLFTLAFVLFTSYLQAQTITGKVTDATTDEAVVGAAVKLLNTDQGTVTDADGNFSLAGPLRFRLSATKHIG